MKNDACVSSPPERLRSTFGDAELHKFIGTLIRKSSTNHEDIYRLSLKGIRFDTPLNVLDLGCGWGAFSSALKGRLAPGSRCTGIDWVEGNREPYLENASGPGVTAAFMPGPASRVDEFGDDAFDLILCGYSLYFFSEVIPEIARILKGDGTALAITHSERSLHEFLEDVRIPLNHDGYLSPEHFGVEEVLYAFSAENGGEKLAPFFKEVEKEPYQNILKFGVSEIEDCFRYLNFKRYIISDESEFQHHFDNERFHKELISVMRARAEREGAYTLTKDDAIFRCTGPGKGQVGG